jgi:hypothetical protein
MSDPGNSGSVCYRMLVNVCERRTFLASVATTDAVLVHESEDGAELVVEAHPIADVLALVRDLLPPEAAAAVPEIQASEDLVAVVAVYGGNALIAASPRRCDA